MSTQPSAFTLGQTTQSQMLALPELAPTDYVNTAGVPDTQADCNTRANAVYPRFIREFIRQCNNVFLGTQIVPGISGVSGKAWRPGDDGSNTVDFADLTAYAIATPSNMWMLNADLSAAVGTPTISRMNLTRNTSFDLVNARGGANGESRLVYALKSYYDQWYRSSANIPTLTTNLVFAGFFTLDGWNQTPDGCVLASYRAYDRADETGAAFRLGFEIGLGRASGSEQGDALTLYYRHVGSNDVEVIKFLDAGGPFSISLPINREVFIAIIRGATAVQVFVNGLVAFTASYAGVGQDPLAGTAPEMRLMLGADWDGSRYFNGSIRNAAVWSVVAPATFPDAAQLLSYYRVGAGFIPKAPA